jgi:ribosomal protein S18 acetylase RimI-like enzyme
LVDLLTRPERGFALVAESQANVIGFATGFVTVSGVLAEHLIHLGDLYVDHRFRRQGVGAQLIAGVVDEARSRKIALVRWLSLSSNTELNRWYESLGATSGEFRLFLKAV